jgi:general secretion pathway protein G
MVNRVNATRLPRKSTSAGQDGFTLVELLVVMSIIGILVGITIGIAGFAGRKTADSEAKRDISELQGILQSYRMEYGSYPFRPDPNTTEYEGPISRLRQDFPAVVDAIVQTNGPIDRGEFGAFATGERVDPWGNPYMFRITRRNSSSPALMLEVWSAGPDPGSTADDITMDTQ